LTDADLLLHVIDITDENAAEQANTVEETLTSLAVAEKPRLTVLNKVDRLTTPEGEPVDSLAAVEAAVPNTDERPDVVLISAEQAWGLDGLKARIGQALSGELVVPASDSSAVGEDGAATPTTRAAV
jgi:GTP-binding protein HflX